MPLNPSIRKVIPAGVPSALASYDYVDIATGTGYESLYAGTTYQNLASGARLSNSKFYSHKVMNLRVQGVTAWKMLHEEDFDMDFVSKRIVKGDAIINIPYGVISDDVTGDVGMYMNVNIQKISGSETTLVTASGAITLADPAASAYVYRNDCMEITIPQTVFKKDDTLRLNVQQFVLVNEGGSYDFFFGHDPNGRATSGIDTRTFGTEPSTLIFQCPFKIEI